MRQDELEGEQQEAGERGELQRRLASRHEVEARSRRAATSTSSARCSRCRSGSPRRGTAASPRSRTATSGRAGSSIVRSVEDVRAWIGCRGRGAGPRTRRRWRRGSRPRTSAFARGLRQPVGVRRPQRDEQQRRRTSSSRRAPPTRRAPTGTRRGSVRRAGTRAGVASFEFELDAYCVNGNAAQANASVTASRRPAMRQPSSASSPRQAGRAAIEP